MLRYLNDLQQVCTDTTVDRHRTRSLRHTKSRSRRISTARGRYHNRWDNQNSGVIRTSHGGGMGGGGAIMFNNVL